MIRAREAIRSDGQNCSNIKRNKHGARMCDRELLILDQIRLPTYRLVTPI